jgi:negative regulator of sigma-B (phosphoserine phosphatase)
VEWGVACRARTGLSAPGNLHVVKEFAGGALVALVVGLGTQEEAAVTAQTAAILLRRYARESVRALMNRCHRNLLMSRGAVIGLARFDATQDRLTWLGVGNVRAWLGRSEGKRVFERLMPYVGVAGYYIPVVRETKLALKPGDTLILASEGAGADFSRDLDFREDPQVVAEGVLKRGFEEDEATVLVARYNKKNGESDGG